GGEFVAEVPLGSDGGFRFFAAPGTWTVRVLAPRGARAEETVSADRRHTTTLAVSGTAPGRRASRARGGPRDDPPRGGRVGTLPPPAGSSSPVQQADGSGLVPQLVPCSSHFRHSVVQLPIT